MPNEPSFDDLLEEKEAAIADDVGCEEAETAAFLAHAEAVKAHETSTARRAAAHQAIHDRLAEKGMHHTVAEDGEVKVYTATDEGQGWRVDHPIPGTKKAAK